MSPLWFRCRAERWWRAGETRCSGEVKLFHKQKLNAVVFTGGGTDAQGDFRPVGWYQDEKTPLSHLEHQVIVVMGVLNTRFTQLFTKTATLSPTLCQFWEDSNDVDVLKSKTTSVTTLLHSPNSELKGHCTALLLFYDLNWGASCLRETRVLWQVRARWVSRGCCTVL